MSKDELMKHLNKHIRKTVAGAIRYDCAELLSKGMNRDVYVCKHDPSWVVKIQKSNNFDNVIEWRMWNAYREAPEWKKWLADCLTITESGLVLYQKRVTHSDFDKYPTSLPCFFTDFKVQNFGWIGKRFVCCDYSASFERMTGIVPNRMRKVRWWTADLPFKRSNKILIKTKL